MEVLKITAEDDKPISCTFPLDITGYTIQLLIGTHPLVSKTAVIDDAENGLFHFTRTPGDLTEGRYESAFLIIDDTAVEETTDPFLVVVNARPA